jgi:hypothetical protein
MKIYYLDGDETARWLPMAKSAEREWESNLKAKSLAIWSALPVAEARTAGSEPIHATASDLLAWIDTRSAS